MQSFEVLKDLYWVGAVDWNIRDFHGYSVPKGTTYNAFLLMDEKVALFDTVKKPFKDTLIHNIRKVVEPQRIDYLIVNHVEMDHSGCVPEMVDLIRPEKLICSPMGKKALIQHYHREDWPYEVVETGRNIHLGRRSVQFIETRMLHWPDSMLSYVPEARLLISSDGFGQHWATSERFDDQVDLPELFHHAARYYANILLPYSPLVQKVLAKVKELGLAIDMIAPDHGLIWRSNVSKILDSYATWSLQQPKSKALLIYDTMWQSTEIMARSIAKGLMEEGVSVRILNLKTNHRSDIITEVLDAGALILGSPTLNNGILPTMADLLCYMKGLRPVNKIAAAFGSYGWSGEAVKVINDALKEMKFDVLEPGIRVHYAPTHDDLQRCLEFGRKIGKAVKERG